MIFLGGVRAALVAQKQGLATGKVPRNRKKAKKSAKYFQRDPRFSAKWPYFSGKNRPV
jgi:hypothetical protein